MRNKLSCKSTLFTLLLLVSLAGGCREAPPVELNAGTIDIQFSSERALAIETEFVTKFPNRDSGQPNNRLASNWMAQQFGALGLSCAFDEWEVINESRPLPLRNVICELAGKSERQIVLIAHQDQSPATIYGADNDGSGVAIMHHLAEIFAAEPQPPYSLVFVGADGEEWGMLGSQRFIARHPDPEQIIAAVSLDNLGKKYYDGLIMDPTGQFRGIGPLWLQLLSQEAAEAGSSLTVPKIYTPLDQLISQGVPVSLRDGGPLIAAGVPAYSLTGICPAEATELCWDTYHSPEDTVDNQSAGSLFQAGGVTEALIRALFTQTEFPQETGPYLYLEGSGQLLRGAPLWAIFLIFVALFFAAGARAIWRASHEPGQWRAALIHFLALWLPMIAAVLLFYLLVELRIMDKWDTYPSLAKGDPIFNPRWPAVIIWSTGFALLLWLGRLLAGRQNDGAMALDPQLIKGMALSIVGLGGVYVLLSNPFSLFLMVPLPAWMLLRFRRGMGRMVDLLIFLLGGSLIIYLFYVFGFELLRNDLVIFWYLMMMFSIRMISFKSAVAITAMFAAGLTMLVNPPLPGSEREGVTIAPAVNP